MDISNNYAGRDIGDSNSSDSDKELLKKVKEQTKNGNLKRIRMYTSSNNKNDRTIDGVMTNYVGYYVPTSNGGLLK